MKVEKVADKNRVKINLKGEEPMLRMDGWCHESTVLAENKGAIDRSNEFIEVTLTVSDEQVTDPAREVRVACKPQWDVWSHLL